ncbi:MAG: diacylglycerol/lipid kinase family protein [Nocardioides sp.]
MEPTLVIGNAAAGSNDEQAMQTGLAVLRSYAETHAASTSDRDELDAVLADAGSRWIVVAGGDGSLHAVVQALHTRGDLAGRVLGLLPLGTGNDFARGAGIPLEVARAAELIGTGIPRPVDLILDSHDQVVVNNVHVGAGAEASRHGARWKTRLGRFGLGRAGYPVGAAIAATKDTEVAVGVYVDGARVTRRGQPVLMVAVGVGSSVGGGTELTPHAKVGDGQLDVMVSFPRSGWARLGYLRDLVRSRHHRRDDVVYLRGTSVSIESVSGSEGFWTSADGEISGPHQRREWRLLAGAYSMVLPPG